MDHLIFGLVSFLFFQYYSKLWKNLNWKYFITSNLQITLELQLFPATFANGYYSRDIRGLCFHTYTTSQYLSHIDGILFHLVFLVLCIHFCRNYDLSTSIELIKMWERETARDSEWERKRKKRLGDEEEEIYRYMKKWRKEWVWGGKTSLFVLKLARYYSPLKWILSATMVTCTIPNPFALCRSVT